MALAVEGNASWTWRPRRNYSFSHKHPTISIRQFRILCMQPQEQQPYEPVLVVIGGGAAGMFGAIRAKNIVPQLKVLVIEKGKPLTKVRISGGGRCNLTNSHFLDTLLLADQYPRGNRELRGSFFKSHGPRDTISWFTNHGVQLKTEDDGRIFPVSDSSSTIVDCLLGEACRNGVILETGKVVTCITRNVDGRFEIKIGRATDGLNQTIQSDYLLIATGSCQQAQGLAVQLGHTVTFSRVRAKLKLSNVKGNASQLIQVGPLLITHWGFSGPVILRLSAWAACLLFSTKYQGTLLVDLTPDLHVEDIKHILLSQKNSFPKNKLRNSVPASFLFVRRFWQYLLAREGLDENTLWASLSHHSLQKLATVIKQCSFDVSGKGEYKDEFVTAGGVPLSEINLNTMESRMCPRLFFAGEVLNVDGLTGGFNFQNAWTGGYIAGTTIGKMVSSSVSRLTMLSSSKDETLL
ncbi:uncharacterized protein LOC131076511 isoform X2 [Cryptomeria japonica]|uniref:uncharacterized protein LOC131076511 isoform X2 n=1 Tax=Cryptomeria japonica TaxID=3369 RepID=UPI0027DAAD80|nr:uncharacterized protein LOC131076511 isoform X2 [Cryptomeria japonica]